MTTALARFAERVTTPLLPADYLDVINPLLSGTQLRGRIVAVHPETRDAVTVVIRPGRGWRPHVPGQYLRIGVEVNGVRHWRAYSITSAGTDRCLSITVKTVPGGIVSTHLAHRTTAGTVVHLEPAAGDFVLSGTDAPVLFLTAGSGITPVMGMLRNLPAEPRDIVVVHSAPTVQDVMFGAELRRLAAAGRIRLVEVHTAPTDAWTSPASTTWCRTGNSARPGPVARRTCSTPSNILGDRASRRPPARRTVPRSPGRHRRRRHRHVLASGTEVEADGATSLLESGESAGVLMPSGCRMGICFGCVAPLRRGAVRDLRTGDLTTAADGDGVVIQTCISAAAGDCDVAL